MHLDLRGEKLTKVLGRLAGTLVRTGLLKSANASVIPALAELAIERDLDIRIVHSVHAIVRPHAICVVDQERWVTWSEMEGLINQTAHLLTAHGLRRHDRIVICMENRLEYLLTWFAAFRLGISAVHASHRSTVEELRYIRENSSAKAVVGSALTIHAIDSAGFEVVLNADPGQATAFWALSKMPTSPLEPIPDADGASVVYTSGTTGKPKGAVRNFTSLGLLELSRLLERLPLHSEARHLVVCPLYHSAAQAFVLIHAALGATLVVERHFDPARALETMDRLAIESTFLVPTMIRRIVDLEHSRCPPALRCVVSGAAAFPHALRMRAIEQFGAESLFDFYGATELGWVTLIRGPEMIERPGSVGRPLSGQTICIGSPERPHGPHEVGRIWVSNAQIMQGYLGGATSGQWLTVDDLGYVDEDGYLYLSGRDRDVVISGGVNIYPVEIEEAIQQVEGIAEAAVVGIPDEQWGERLIAYFVGEVDPKDIERELRRRLAGYKVPREWRKVDKLPRNPTGKVLKTELRG